MSYNLIDLPKENYQRVISSSDPLYVSVGSLSAADATTLSIGVVVSVFSGTSANMYLQESYDNGTTWTDLPSFTADLIGGTGTFKTKVAPQNGPMSPLVRLKVLPAGATLVGISKIWRTFVQSNVMIPRDASISNGATETTLLSILSDTGDILTSVDGLETLIGTTNSTLTTIDGRVDGLETLVGATNTKLDTVITHVDGVETKLDTLHTDLGTTIHNDLVSTNSKLDTVNTKLSGSFVPVAFDYSALTPAALTDTWVYKTGGAGGTTVKTVVITFTDATKTVISTVAAT